ncbi:hypothetical protein C3942_10665 [Solimonas fluminis]|uniref:Uncharacterized protein n=1 Tax=Solimonas fluminis TaxID=2086571 RepID=A0A2S5TFT4_9GAMM|nr:hypothetical protein [Solimonas fluminis]PPE73856.1 hypothetical protein C3942_10665 [Solimonas fluminis]
MLLLAALVFAGLSVATAWLEQALHRNTREEALRLWGEWFLLPLARVFCLMAFIVLAGASLYGLRDIPSPAELLAQAPGRTDRLITWLFFTGLLLPAVPLLRRVPGLVLPLQGGAGVALVFTWLAAAADFGGARLWPDLPTLLMLAALSGFAMACAHLLTQAVQDEVRRQEAYDLLLLWLQLPLLVAYGHWLGRQLPA